MYAIYTTDRPVNKGKNNRAALPKKHFDLSQSFARKDSWIPNPYRLETDVVRIYYRRGYQLLERFVPLCVADNPSRSCLLSFRVVQLLLGPLLDDVGH